MLDFARSFGLPAAVLRMSGVVGARQCGTEDRGCVAHFLLRAMAGESVTIYGDGRRVRDVLLVDDAVAAYLAAWRRIGAVSGWAFNLGGGPAQAISLRDLASRLEELCDQRWFVADASAARAALELEAPLDPYPGAPDTAAWGRAHAHYPTRFAAFSDIQDAAPLALAELEAAG